MPTATAPPPGTRKATDMQTTADYLDMDAIAERGQVAVQLVFRWAANTGAARGTFRGGIPGTKALNVDCITTLRYLHSRGWITYVGTTQPPRRTADVPREYVVITASGARQNLYAREVPVFATTTADVLGGPAGREDLEAFWEQPQHELKRVLPARPDYVDGVTRDRSGRRVEKRMWHADRVTEALRHWGHLPVNDSTEPGPSYILETEEL